MFVFFSDKTKTIMATKDTSAAGPWAPGSWREKPAKQLIKYDDEVALGKATAQLSQLPPLISTGEVSADK